MAETGKDYSDDGDDDIHIQSSEEYNDSYETEEN